MPRGRSSLASDSSLGSAPEVFDRLRPSLGGRLLVASDFDGTISAMVLDPWSATILPTAQRALRRLATISEVDVALISGRTVSDLASRARIGGVAYLGDHGAEHADAPRGFRVGALHVEREPVDAATSVMAARLKTEVPPRVDEPWLVLEDKGPALTFHFRAAPDTEAARARVIAAVDAVDPDEVLYRAGGVRAWELRPHGATTKGTAVSDLIERCRPDAVLMLGDDRHDALAFDTLRAARRAGHIEGLAVGVVSRAGFGTDVADHADVMLPDSLAAARLLSSLASHLVRARD